MVLNVHRNHKAYWGRGQGGLEVGGKREMGVVSQFGLAVRR